MEIGRLQKSFILSSPASLMPSNVQVVLTLLHFSALKWNFPIVWLSLWVPQVGDRQKRECHSICNWVYEDIIRRTFQGSSEKRSHQFHLFPAPKIESLMLWMLKDIPPQQLYHLGHRGTFFSLKIYGKFLKSRVRIRTHFFSLTLFSLV